MLLPPHALSVNEEKVQSTDNSQSLNVKQMGKKNKRSFPKVLSSLLKVTERQTSRESFPERLSARGVTRCQHRGSARVPV